MATPKILLLPLLTSILLLFTIFILCFTPLSSSPLVSKALSFFDEPPTSLFDHIQPPQPEPEFEQAENNPQLGEDVVVLGNNNFSDFVGKHEYVMVKFYAPWCYWSQKLAPEYAAAATMLKPRAVLAEVDCTQQAELGRKFDIQGYPTVRLFVGGGLKVFYTFYEERTRDSIANWVDQKMNNSVRILASVEEAERVLESNSLTVVGFLDSLQGEESEELAAVAKKHIDVNFYQTANADVAKLFHIKPETKSPALVIVERDQWSRAETHLHYEGEFTRSAIAEFVSTYKLPASVTTFSAEEAHSIFENPMKQLWLFAPKSPQRVISTFKQVATMFKGKLLFVHVDTSDEDSVGRKLAYDFGVTEGTTALVAYQTTIDGQASKQVHHGDLTLDGIEWFAEELMEDKIESKSDSSTETVIKLPLNDPSSIPHTY